MENFDNILNSVQWSQQINKSLGMTSQIAGMIKTQEIVTKSLSGLLTSQIAASMANQMAFSQSTSSMIQAITKSFNSQPKFIIPQATFAAIASISQQHEKAFVGIREMAQVIKAQSPTITQINNFQFALSSISSQIAAIAAQQKNWSLITDFEDVTEQALEFTETLSQEITEEQQKQFQILLALVFTFFKKHKTLGVSALLIIDIFLRFADIHQYYDFLKEKPELSTQAEVNNLRVNQDSVLHFIQAINKHLKEAKEYRITNRVSEVKLKPKSKTITLTKLPKDFEVIVIQIHHKWVYISYFNPKDNLPETGWIMKKYLDKP